MQDKIIPLFPTLRPSPLPTPPNSQPHSTSPSPTPPKLPSTAVAGDDRSSTSIDLDPHAQSPPGTKDKRRNRLSKLLRIVSADNVIRHKGPSSAPASLDDQLPGLETQALDLATSPPVSPVADPIVLPTPHTGLARKGSAIWNKLRRRNTTISTSEHIPASNDNGHLEESSPARAVRFASQVHDHNITEDELSSYPADAESSSESLDSGSDNNSDNIHHKPHKRRKKRKAKRLAKKMFSWWNSSPKPGPLQAEEIEVEPNDDVLVNNPVLHLVTAALAEEVPDDKSSIHSLFLRAPHVLQEDDQPTPNLPSESDVLSQTSNETDTEEGGTPPSPPSTPPPQQRQQPLTISQKLQIAFDLPDPEPYQAEFACYLIRSILLKGYMYLTSHHLCFYASLPSQAQSASSTSISHPITHSAFLRKKTKSYTGVKSYIRYWFTLEDDTLAYYASSTGRYYPLGRVNLRNVSEVREEGSKGLVVAMVGGKKWKLKADTETARGEWVAWIREGIVRARNWGDDVRIVLPFANIVEMDVSGGTSSVTESLRIKVIDDESSQTEEYYFAYFNSLSNAFDTLNTLWTSHRISTPSLTPPSRRKSMYDTTSTSLPSRPSTPQSRSSRDLIPTVTESKPSIPSRSSFHRRTRSDLNVAVTTSDSDGSSRASLESLESSDGTVGAKRGWRRWGHRKTRSEGGNGIMVNSISGGAAVSVEKLQVEKVGEVKEKEREREKEKEVKTEEDKFRRVFGLLDSEKLLASYPCSLHRTIPLLGRLYLTPTHLAFKSTVIGLKTRILIPISDITGVSDISVFGMGKGISIKCRGGDEVIFEVRGLEVQKGVVEGLRRVLGSGKMESKKREEVWALEGMERELHIGRAPDTPPSKPLHITLLTIGTRGDVQPYIALALRLKQDNHTVRIATHTEYQSWIESFSIEFRPIKGNPAELMRLCVENGMFTYKFMREAVSKFRTWIDELLQSSYEACLNPPTDLLVESPTAFAGVHVAEALRIPYFAAFPMPWTRTRWYPHPFAVGESSVLRGGGYNWMTHVMIEGLLWRGIQGQVNRFRKTVLGRPPINTTTFSPHTTPHTLPFLYSFSPTIVPPPPDWPDWIHTTGYWFLSDSDPTWTPSASLTKFFSDAKKDDIPVVYIGFGSIVVSDPIGLTKRVIEGVVSSGVRCILSKGWSGRLGSKDPKEEEEEIIYPPSIYLLTTPAPHSYLLPLCTAAIHHGGSGTTAACLRAKIPQGIHPFFGDQFFWAQRISQLGVGVVVRKLTAAKLGKKIVRLVGDEVMRRKAKVVGEQVSEEDGVGEAVRCLYRDLEFSRGRVEQLRVWVDGRWGKGEKEREKEKVAA